MPGRDEFTLAVLELQFAPAEKMGQTLQNSQSAVGFFVFGDVVLRFVADTKYQIPASMTVLDFKTGTLSRLAMANGIDKNLSQEKAESTRNGTGEADILRPLNPRFDKPFNALMGLLC